MKLSFTKMQGCANDYIYLDCRASGVPADIAALAQRLSARHFSVGADGIICICAPVTPGADGRMRIFNADGSEAQMCGNGVRCVAEWLYTHGVEKPVLTIDTNSGVKRISRQGAQLWQVEMGAYSTLPADLPAIHMGEGPLVDQPLTVEGKVWKVTCISVGNPHCVTVVEDVDSLKLEAIGPEAMYAKLQAVDPEAAAAIHPNNKVRVLRALEHYRATGKRLSEQKADSLPPERPYRSLVLGLDFPERAALYRRIDLRVDKMLEAGLLAEAEYVWRNREAFRTAAQAIGYKEFFPYFQQTATLEVCTEKLKQASRNYAKRQLTWFRHMDGVTWLDAGAADVRQTALRLTQDFLLKG